MDQYVPLIPGQDFHVFHRAVGSEQLFVETDNYHYFLKRYTHYIVPFVHTLAYCLLPNHFHFVVRIKSEEEIVDLYRKKFPFREWKTERASQLLIKQWSNLMNSYAKSFNKKYNRKGSLFMDYLKRVPIETEAQFCGTIFYTHTNPVHHEYCNSMSEWRFSSFNAYQQLSSSTLLSQNLVLDYFDGIDQFKKYHEQPINLKNAVKVE